MPRKCWRRRSTWLGCGTLPYEGQTVRLRSLLRRLWMGPLSIPLIFCLWRPHLLSTLLPLQRTLSSLWILKSTLHGTRKASPNSLYRQNRDINLQFVFKISRMFLGNVKGIYKVY